jgi:hypothetical protein
MRRPAAYVTTVTAAPATSGSTRGAFVVRSPTRSATYRSGRCSGPCGENRSRNGTTPSRISIAERPKKPSSYVRWRLATKAGMRNRTAMAASTAASIHHVRRSTVGRERSAATGLAIRGSYRAIRVPPQRVVISSVVSLGALPQICVLGDARRELGLMRWGWSWPSTSS